MATKRQVDAEIRRRFKAAQKAVASAVNKGARIVQAAIREEIPAKTRFHGLARSVQIERAEGKGGVVLGKVTILHPGARLREYGNPDIRPGKSIAKSGPGKGKKTRALAIPLPGARTEYGVARGGPAMYEDLKFIPIDSGGSGGAFAVLAEVIGTGKRERVNPIFALVARASVKPHPYVRPAVDRVRDQVVAVIEESIDRAIRGGA